MSVALDDSKFTMSEDFSRLGLLVGAAGVKRLSSCKVLVCGLGGVGSWAAECLVRSAVGCLGLADYDTIKTSNLNRQLHSLHSTLGQPKTAVLAARFLDINPQLKIQEFSQRLTPENVPEILSCQNWDYIIDAIDERPAKLALITYCLKNHLRLISCMGTACKLHPELLTVADISETYGCPLAKILRKHLHRLGITSGLTVVYSPELPDSTMGEAENPGERRPLGTIMYMPALAGLRLAAEVIQTLLQP